MTTKLFELVAGMAIIFALILAAKFVLWFYDDDIRRWMKQKRNALHKWRQSVKNRKK